MVRNTSCPLCKQKYVRYFYTESPIANKTKGFNYGEYGLTGEKLDINEYYQPIS